MLTLLLVIVYFHDALLNPSSLLTSMAAHLPILPLAAVDSPGPAPRGTDNLHVAPPRSVQGGVCISLP